MKKSQITESQIVKAIHEHEKRRKAEDLCRELGSSFVTFYKWRQRYGGMSVPELKRVKEPEVENSKFKKMFANLSSVLDPLPDAVAKQL